MDDKDVKVRQGGRGAAVLQALQKKAQHPQQMPQPSPSHQQHAVPPLIKVIVHIHLTYHCFVMVT